MRDRTRGSGLALASAFLIAAFAASPDAHAEEDVALTAFETGRFLEAARAAKAQGDQQHLSIAARALLAHVIASDDDVRNNEARIEEAIEVAQRHLALEPDSAAARLDLAFALGFKSRRMGRIEALRKGYARVGKRLIDEAIALEPDNAWAYAMLGGWNCEVLRRGGGMGARLYGAKLERGIEAFEQALALAPSDPAIALHYAVALLGLDAERYASRARDLLASAAASRGRDAFARLMSNEARRLGAVMDSQGALAAAEEANRRLA